MTRQNRDSKSYVTPQVTYTHPDLRSTTHTNGTAVPEPDRLTAAIARVRRDVTALLTPEIQTVLREEGDTQMQQVVIEARIASGRQPPRINFPKMWAALHEVEDYTPLLSMAEIEELTEAEPNERLAYGLFPRGGIGLLAGPKGVGKSSLGKAFARAVARGTTFLGRPIVRAGPVILYSTEELRGEVGRDLLALTLNRDDRVYVRYGRMPLQTFVKRLQEDVRAVRPALVFVDTLTDVLQLTDINDYMTVSAAMARLQAVMCHTDAFLLANHHTGKWVGRGRPTVEGVLGSTALIGKVDGIILLYRTQDDTREVMVWKRYRSDQALEWTPLTYDRHTGDVMLAETTGARSNAGTEEATPEPTTLQLVLAELEKMGEEAPSRSELARRIPRKRQEVFAAIREGLERNLLHDDAPPDTGVYLGPWKPYNGQKKA